MQWSAIFSARFYGSVDEIKRLGPEMAKIHEKNGKSCNWKDFQDTLEQLAMELTIPENTLASQANNSEICIGFDDIEALEMEDGVMWALRQLEEAVPNVSMAILDRNENYLNFKYFSPSGQCVLKNCYDGNVNNYPKLDWIPNEWRELKPEEEFEYADMVFRILCGSYGMTASIKEKVMAIIKEYVAAHDEEFSYYQPDGCNSYSDMDGIFEIDLDEAKEYLGQGEEGEECDDNPTLQLAVDVIQNLVPELEKTMGRHLRR